MQLDTIEYKGWTQNLRLSNGLVDLLITLDVGPRILHFGFAGDSKNYFGTFDEQLGTCSESKWMLWGGHRLWVAPEHKPKTYELDNDPVAYESIPDGVRLIQSPGQLSCLKKNLEIRLVAGKPQVHVTHLLTNTCKAPVECSPWALSVMAQCGTAIIPLPAIVIDENRVSPNQNWSSWSYTNWADPRLIIGSRYVRVLQDPSRGPLKLGMAHREGWVAYQINGGLFVKSFDWQEGAVYPDGNVNFEVYTDKRILELETLAPLVHLAPNETVRHEERWCLHRDVPLAESEEDIDRVIRPLAVKS